MILVACKLGIASGLVLVVAEGEEGQGSDSHGAGWLRAASNPPSPHPTSNTCTYVNTTLQYMHAVKYALRL